ncbi:Protein kinase domain, partial [Sesbania bispinosa]
MSHIKGETARLNVSGHKACFPSPLRLPYRESLSMDSTTRLSAGSFVVWLSGYDLQENITSRAPEVILGQGHGSVVDWWTFGVFLYEMLYGRTPFKGENNEKTLVNILKQPLTFPRIAVSSSSEYEEMVKVQDLISKLLVKNPNKRIGSCMGSAEIKRHEFFKG